MSFFASLYDENGKINDKGLRVKFYTKICRSLRHTHCLSVSFVEELEARLQRFLQMFFTPYKSILDWHKEFNTQFDDIHKHDTTPIRAIIQGFYEFEVDEKEGYTSKALDESHTDFHLKLFWYCFNRLPEGVSKTDKYNSIKYHSYKEITKALKKSPKDKFLFSDMIPYTLTKYSQIAVTALLEYLVAECTDLTSNKYTDDVFQFTLDEDLVEDFDQKKLEKKQKALQTKLNNSNNKDRIQIELDQVNLMLKRSEIEKQMKESFFINEMNDQVETDIHDEDPDYPLTQIALLEVLKEDEELKEYLA